MALSINQWVGKLAVVTGASAGIGAAIAKTLAEQGINVVGLARRVEKVAELSKTLKNPKGKLHPMKCDITDEENVKCVFEQIQKIGPVHVLVNNAGTTKPTTLYNGEAKDWRQVTSTNILGPCIVTKEAIKIMCSCNIAGQIININSILGHFVYNIPKANIYSGTKHALTALTETLRLELVEIGSRIKISVAGLARRSENVEKLSNTIKNPKGQLHAVKCDVTKEDDILKAFKWISTHLGPVHVLVNNAGIIEHTTLSDGDTDKWRKVFDVNIIGLCICTREAIRVMKAHKIDGHIFQMNSILGHAVIPAFPGVNVYPATKHCVTALAELVRLELVEQSCQIKITSISPGPTESEIIDVAGMADHDLNKAFTKRKILESEDIADGIVYALSTPPHCLVKELTIKPVTDPF